VAQDPLKASFKNFLLTVWRHLSLPDPTPLQYDIAGYLARGPRRRIVEAFRGCGKSWITATYALWRLYVNPDERILMVSASKERADMNMTFCRNLLRDMPALRHLEPRKDQRDKANAFDVGPSSIHQSPSLRSVGITGQLTGGRASLIIADDVEVPKNSLTQAQRDKLAEAIKEFDAVLLPEGQVVYLGTPQTEMSIYNVLPERGYEIRVWPARVPTEKQEVSYGDRIAPFIQKLLDDPKNRGKSSEPARFTEDDLMERELSYGRSGFSLQFMLDTSASDAERYPLKLRDLLVMDCSPEVAPIRVVWASGQGQRITDMASVGLTGDYLYSPMWVSPDFQQYSGVVLAIDPAGQGGDEVGYAVVAMLNGMLYLLKAGGLPGGYSADNLDYLARLAAQFKVFHVRVETNFGDGMFEALLQPYLQKHWPVTVESKRNSTQKERRIIDTLEPVMNQHRLVVDRRAMQDDQLNTNGYAAEHAHKYQLFYQLTRITKERGALAKDDRLDALAMAVSYWVEQLSNDVEKVIQEHKEKALQAELDKFIEAATGSRVDRHKWNPIR
jgi:hypothetical protein